MHIVTHVNNADGSIFKGILLLFPFVLILRWKLCDPIFLGVPQGVQSLGSRLAWQIKHRSCLDTPFVDTFHAHGELFVPRKYATLRKHCFVKNLLTTSLPQSMTHKAFLGFCHQYSTMSASKWIHLARSEKKPQNCNIRTFSSSTFWHDPLPFQKGPGLFSEPGLCLLVLQFRLKVQHWQGCHWSGEGERVQTATNWT